jgi:hypothetical protein
MNSAFKLTVGGISGVLAAAGGILFFIGGRALHEFAGVDRVIAEIEGLAAAAVLIALGVGLRAAAGLPLTKRQ